MSAVSGAVPNLVGGVSQQPPEIRALNTSTALLNSWSDVATGLSTRPYTRHVGDTGPAPEGTVATHSIQKPSGLYHISIYDGQVRVLNLGTGQQEPVSIQGAAGGYIDVADPAANIGFLTIADTTFVYNKTRVIEKTTQSESGREGMEYEGLTRLSPNRFGTVWVKQRAGYNANYALYINNQLEAVVVTDAWMPSGIATVQNDSLKNQLDREGFTTHPISQTMFSVEFDNDNDYLNSTDDFGEQAISTYNDYVPQFSDLSKMDKSGRLVLVKQEKGEVADDYWVWFKDNRWEETFGWGSYEKPVDDTMPMILVDNRDGTWTLKPTEWAGRTVGDTDSNPTPSFVGRTIRYMMIHKGRMCLLADENFIASRVGDFENFYRSSCAILLDDDPIDVASPNSGGATLNFGREFEDGLLLFSELYQFSLRGNTEGLLSPNTVQIKRVNDYNNAPDVEPSFVGPNPLFVDDFGSRRFALLQEYQTERVFGQQIALPITDQVPEYIPTGVYRIVGSSTSNTVAVLTKGERSRVWMYQYYFNSEGKVQSAWQQWEIAGDIYGADFNEDRLVLTVVMQGRLHILDLTFDSGADMVLSAASVMLDWRVDNDRLEFTYEDGDTLIRLPFWTSSSYRDRMVAVVPPLSGGDAVDGQMLVPDTFDGRHAVFHGRDLRNSGVLMGLRYRFYWKLSPIYMRDGNLVAVQDGRLQLKRVQMMYSDSGPFVVRFRPTGRDQVYESRFSGFVLGDAQNTLNNLTLENGSYSVSVLGRSTDMDLEVEAWTPWRVRFSSLEWRGTYRAKTARTT